MGIGGKTSISGDAVDICHNNQYVVTGGGSLGEGVQLWDFRDLENPVVNCVKFLHRQDLILVGCSDDNVSVKCFNRDSGNVFEEFPHVRGNCFTMDVASDGSFCCFGDAEGRLHFENI